MNNTKLPKMQKAARLLTAWCASLLILGCTQDPALLEAPGSLEVTDYRDLPQSEASLKEVTQGLDAPWGFDWLPNGDILVTERFGTLRLIRDGQLVTESISGMPEVFASGQGGLLDITVHPDFAENNFVYFSYAHGSQEQNRLRVSRATLQGMRLENEEVIFEVAQTKSGTQHYGSRFQWMPDKTLLISVGDGGNPPITYNGELIREQAQNLTSHLGKVVRIRDDGSVPEDNPFTGRPDVLPEIWTYGHRNIQGITFDSDRNQVLVSEHGSKGGDEVNQTRAGLNYGWPLASFSTEYDAFSTPISPDRTLPNTENPVAVWTPTIAPSELVYYTGSAYENYQGDVFLAAMLLRENTSILAYADSPAGAILRLNTTTEGQRVPESLISLGDYRVRSIEQGPDGFLYALTDATGRQTRAGTNAGALWRIESFN